MSNARVLSKQGNNPAFSVAAPNTQTPTAGAFTKIQLTAEDFDTNNAFDNATNYRFTPQVPGYYQINGIFCTVQTNGGAFCEIRKNGTRVALGTSSAFITGIGTSGTVSHTIYLNGSTDYVELWGYHNGTGTVTVAGETKMSGFLARGT